MSHLLHIDSSVQGDVSVSRRLTARAADRWRAAHPGGIVTYRDLATNPIPHLGVATGVALSVPAEKRTPAHQAALALSVELIEEIKQAETVLLGVPLYNGGPPSTVKSWVDHLIVKGLAVDAETGTGLVGIPTSSCLPPAAVGTVRARRVKAGIMLSPGYHTCCRC